MKKLSLILIFLFISTFAFSQKNFTNGTGNHLWSDAGNWANGKPSALNAVVVIKSNKVIIDENVTIGWLKKGKISELFTKTIHLNETSKNN
jgi:hypothetical protein